MFLARFMTTCWKRFLSCMSLGRRTSFRVLNPTSYSTLSVTMVNTWGLVYVWKGWNRSLKPLLLTAHQGLYPTPPQRGTRLTVYAPDVVPVDPETADSWKYPPYSGYFDGERIWGRGTADDKNGLIATLSVSQFRCSRVLTFSIERQSSTWYPRVSSPREHWFWPSVLMKNQVVPRHVSFPRVVSTILTFKASQGAGALSEYLLTTFGRNAFALIVDEGGVSTPRTHSRELPDTTPNQMGSWRPMAL